MSFRRKIIVFVVLLSSCLFVVLYSSLLFVLSKNFVYLENDDVNRRLRRVESVSNVFFANLKSKVFDWGEWDNSYNFLAGNEPEFFEQNLNEVALNNLGLNAVVFVNNQGQVIGSYAYDFLSRQEDTEFINLFEAELKDLYFKDYFMSADYNQGVVMFPAGQPPLYLVSKQVFRSDRSGPSLGYLFMGRYLDNEFVDDRFGDVALYSTFVDRVDSPNLSVDFLEARDKLLMNEKLVIIPGGPKNIFGYSLFNDYSDAPAFIFRIETTRTLYQYENNILLYVSILLFVMILIFVLVFLWMIDRVFTSRLIKVFNKVEEYKNNPNNNDIDIAIPGKDELSKLSIEFNSLVKEISSSGNFYKNLLSRLPDIVVLIKDGRVVYANDAIESNTGFKKEEFVGKSVFDFIDKKYQSLVEQNMKLRYSGVDVLPYTIKMLTKNDLLDVRVDGKIIDYHGEKVTLAVLTNISETSKNQRKIEEKVSELERLNRVMINRELAMMELKKKIKESEEKK